MARSSSTIDSTEDDGSRTANESKETQSIYSAPDLLVSIGRRGKKGPADEGEWVAPSSKHLSNLRILVVDDNALNTRLLGAFLKKYRCGNIQEAENGAEAVKAVKEHTEVFDITFMDLSMPVMDGFDATRKIRTIENERGCSRQVTQDAVPAVIVALTRLASDREEAKAYASGVDLFITKPVRFAGLEQLLKQHEDGSLWKSSQ
ncbi:CheY-like superfamily [Clohesyomyces aquaticus]|uniref:CheY-like superfamily n=1 Tax=Clohesyomyces aquaticus TaxID=1231657 RepID=A0A1Y1ZDP3_9PLEO|nr:CheY-like superfamily [Clohesyomyces aquaticus]